MNKSIILILMLFVVSCGPNNNSSNPDNSPTPENNNDQLAPSVNADKVFYVFNGSTTTGDTLRELYMTYANGTGNTQLTFSDNGDVKEYFGLSTNGYVIYQTGNNLYSVPIASSSAAATNKITNDPIFTMTPHAISTDNRVIYSDGWVLYSVPADGSQTPVYLNSAHSSDFIGLTSNNLVIFSDDNGLYARDPAASNPSTQLSPANTGSHSTVVTGSKVVYADNGALKVYVVDTAVANPSQIQIDTGSVDNLATSGEYAFYSKSDGNASHNLWRAKLDGSDTMQLTTSTGTDDRFVALDSNGRVIYQKRGNSQDDLYSVSISGGIETALAANPTKDDTFKGLAPGNRVIIQTLENHPYFTITSVKSDGTEGITLAAGTTGQTRGGNVETVTPDGWVIYQMVNETATMTSVKADNTAKGSFTHIQGNLSITSDNRVIATLMNSTGDMNLYSVQPSGLESFMINTINSAGWDEFVAVVP